MTGLLTIAGMLAVGAFGCTLGEIVFRRAIRNRDGDGTEA